METNEFDLETETLQADVMRFLAIISFSLLIIFVPLVQEASRQETSARSKKEVQADLEIPVQAPQDKASPEPVPAEKSVPVPAVTTVPAPVARIQAVPEEKTKPPSPDKAPPASPAPPVKAPEMKQAPSSGMATPETPDKANPMPPGKTASVPDKVKPVPIDKAPDKVQPAPQPDNPPPDKTTDKSSDESTDRKIRKLVFAEGVFEKLLSDKKIKAYIITLQGDLAYECTLDGGSFNFQKVTTVPQVFRLKDGTMPLSMISSFERKLPGLDRDKREYYFAPSAKISRQITAISVSDKYGVFTINGEEELVPEK
jgi:hypothetical protein